jgi:hypothetical protein
VPDAIHRYFARTFCNDVRQYSQSFGAMCVSLSGEPGA